MYNYKTQKKMQNHKHVDTQTKSNTCRLNSECRHDTDTNVEPQNKKCTTTQPIKKMWNLKHVDTQTKLNTCRQNSKCRHDTDTNAEPQNKKGIQDTTQ